MTDLQVPSIGAAEAMEGGFQVVDVRSPSEFADGHMPGALNFPLLGDAQRATVGIAYKEEGAAQARLVAMELVSAGLPEYLGDLVRLARSQTKGRRLAIMCWRGGERSRNVALLLALVGVHVVTVSGGYRAYRTEVLNGLAEWRSPVPVVTLYGHTGAGQERASPRLGGPRRVRGGRSAGEGARPWVVDLEELALHRGSLLGGLEPTGRASPEGLRRTACGTSSDGPKGTTWYSKGREARSGGSSFLRAWPRPSAPACRCWSRPPSVVRARRIMRRVLAGDMGRCRPSPFRAQSGTDRGPPAARKSGRSWKEPSLMVDLPTSSRGCLPTTTIRSTSDRV